METQQHLWQKHAAHWANVRAPLRPCAQDVVLNERVIHAWARCHGAPRALLLGVTPELAKMHWPRGTDLLAVDQSLDMIQQIWPGFPRPGAGALHADWLNLPLGSASRDLVVGDGCTILLRYPDRQRCFLHSVNRVLAVHGKFVLRAFVQPQRREEPEAVIAELLHGRIGNFHIFKFRLLMALALGAESGAGIQLGRVWDYWSRWGPSAEALAEQLGWPMAEIATIDAYRDRDARHYVPTLAELRALLLEIFDLEECVLPDYEMGSRCPLFVLTRRAPGLALAA